MKNASVGFSDAFQAIPHFPALENEIVMRIDYQKCGDFPLVSQASYGLSDDRVETCADCQLIAHSRY